MTDQTTEKDDMLALLREAEDLLSSARTTFTDPGLARRWGQRRRRLRDRIFDLTCPPGQST